MESSVSALLAAIAVIVGASVTYAKTFGSQQEALTQIAVDTFAIKSRYKRATNLAVGLLLASILTVVAAYAIGNLVVIPGGIVAGLFASVEAQRVHEEKPDPPDATPKA